MRSRCIAPVVALLGLLPVFFPTPVEASCDPPTPAAHFYLRVEQQYQTCHLNFIPPPIPLVYVYVDVSAVPMTSARLSLPNPPVGIVFNEEWFWPTTGNRMTGMEFDFSACTPHDPQYPWLTLGRLTVFVPPGTVANCLPWKIDDGCEITDCDEVARMGVAHHYQVTTNPLFCVPCCLECCPSLPPYDLFPPNAASRVPLDVEMSWTNWHQQDPKFGTCQVKIGTDPDCADWTNYPLVCGEETFLPNFLEPATTYYWRVYYQSGCVHSESPVHSFTTEGPLPATPASWGRVKAMYRD